MDRTFEKKHKTRLAYEKRKYRTPKPRRSRIPPRSRPSVAKSDATLDSQSTDVVNNTDEMLHQCVSSSEDNDVDATVHRREAAHSPNEDPAVQRDSDMIDAPTDAGNPRPQL
ncbi:hypothetical protein MRX96_019317 [Rhipicephalus microplus]